MNNRRALPVSVVAVSINNALSESVNSIVEPPAEVSLERMIHHVGWFHFFESLSLIFGGRSGTILPSFFRSSAPAMGMPALNTHAHRSSQSCILTPKTTIPNVAGANLVIAHNATQCPASRAITRIAPTIAMQCIDIIADVGGRYTVSCRTWGAFLPPTPPSHSSPDCAADPHRRRAARRSDTLAAA
jgi:hypothetical protein